MNKVMLMGRLTKDPEIRYSANNNLPVVSFTLAVNRKFVKEGEERQADFIFCKAFGKTAEFCNNYYKKGQQVAISGRIQTGSYEKEGQRVFTTDVVIEDAYFADSKRENGASDVASQNTTGAAPGFFPVDSGEDDLPF